MKNYSIVRVGDEYVVRAGDASVLRIGSRRWAAQIVNAAELLNSLPPPQPVDVESPSIVGDLGEVS